MQLNGDRIIIFCLLNNSTGTIPRNAWFFRANEWRSSSSYPVWPWYMYVYYISSVYPLLWSTTVNRLVLCRGVLKPLHFSAGAAWQTTHEPPTSCRKAAERTINASVCATDGRFPCISQARQVKVSDSGFRACQCDWTSGAGITSICGKEDR